MHNLILETSPEYKIGQRNVFYATIDYAAEQIHSGIFDYLDLDLDNYDFHTVNVTCQNKFALL